MNRLFKFRAGTSQDLEAFHHNYIWFSAFSQLNDPFEGLFKYDFSNITTELRIKLLSYIYKEQKRKNHHNLVVDKFAELGEKEFSNYVDERVKEYYYNFCSDYKNSSFIYSYSIAATIDDYPIPLTNILLWSHYANGFTGYCIEYDFDLLKSSIEEENNIKISSSHVDYPSDYEFPSVSLKTFMSDLVSADSKKTSIEVFKAICTKHPVWHYECEGRFISNKQGKHFYHPESIRAIYIPDKTPDWIRQYLIYSIKSKNSQIKIYNVKISDNKYEIGFAKIE